MNEWVSFKDLRASLDFEKVLHHYGVEIKRKGSQHHGFCPLPDHQGKRNSPSFSANLDKGIFQCFGCGAKGNVLEFAAMMQKVDVNNGTALRSIALDLKNRFCPDLQKGQKPTRLTEQDAKPRIEPAIINSPLDFELKGLDVSHPYLLSRGFSTETITHFGLGYCTRGSLANRVAIPLRNHKGNLVGYAGRVVDDTLVGEENPRYRFPSKRERQGKVLEFRKTLFLYNGFSIAAPVEDLVIVEGFPSVWWLHQNGFPHVVATMGADCSTKQAELIVSLVSESGRVWLMPDGDDAGLRFAESVLLQVSPHRFIRWLRLETGQQPTDFSKEQINTCLNR
jgi:DNA primase